MPGAIRTGGVGENLTAAGVDSVLRAGRGTGWLTRFLTGVLGRLLTEGDDGASIIWTLSSKEIRRLDLCRGGATGFLPLPPDPLPAMLTPGPLRPPTGGGDRGGSPCTGGRGDGKAVRGLNL